MAITEQRRLRARCDIAAQGSRQDSVQSSAIAPPAVTIGLPVYNGENFLADAIESVLAQTFEDYELIICDNASTDRTEQICRRYAQQDKRIRYYRSVCNEGPARNYNWTFELTRGRYFKWAAHDDCFEPALLEKLVDRLEQHPEAVLSFSQVKIIDAAGDLLAPYTVEMQLDSDRPARRFQEMISLKHRCYEVFGLIRKEVLDKTPLIGSYAGSDRALLSRLSLMGRFEIVPEPLFLAREHAQQSIAMLRQPRFKLLRMHDYAVWFDPNNKGKVLFPNWRILTEYLLAIRSVPIGGWNQMMCLWVLCQWLLAYRNIAKLCRDIAIAAAQFIGRLRPPANIQPDMQSLLTCSPDSAQKIRPELTKLNNSSLKS